MTNDFKQECKKTAYKNRLGKIEYDNKSISNKDDLASIEINDSCVSNGEIIGNTNAKSIKIKTINNYDLADKEINPFIGVKYADTSEEYIKLGKYTIDIPKDDKVAKNGEYEGINVLSKLDDKYVCGITDFTNCTVLDFYKDLCSQLNLTPKKLDFINKDIPVSGNPFTNNETCRTVLQNIAQVFCSFVDIDDVTNEIDLIWFDEEYSETFEKKDYSELERNQVYGPVNSLSIKESAIEGENVVKEQNGKEIKELIIQGNANQKTTNGYQLFDESKCPSRKSDSGVTLTNNGDGSFTIEGSGNLTFNFNEHFNYSHEETLKLLKAGNITISDNGVGGNTSVPYYLMQLRNSQGTIFEISNRINNSHTKNITQEMLNDESCYMRIGFFGANNTSVTPKTIKPMLYQDGNGKFEKFTGGKPSPSPDYPQEIETVKGNIKLLHTNKNICPTDFNDWESGHYGMNGGKQSHDNRIRLKDLVKVTPNESYYVNTFSDRHFAFIFRTYDLNKKFIRSIGIIGDNSIFKLNDKEEFISVTIGDNLQNTTFEEFSELFKSGAIKPFICLNSEIDKSFVEHKEEFINIDMHKKNLFNVQKYVQNNSEFYTIDENENVTCIKTDSRSSDFDFYLELSVGRTYTLSTTNNCNLRVYESDDSSFPSQTASFQRNDKNRIIFTTTKPYVTFKTFNSSSPSTIGQIRLFEGTNIDDSYELASLDDVKDELIIDELGNVELIKNVEKYVFDEERDYQLSSLPADWECTRFRTVQVVPNSSTDNYISLSNKFITRLPNSESTDNEYVLFSNGYIYFSIKKSRLEENTSSAFKKWIQDNPITIYYKLAEEKVINLGKTESIELFEGINNFNLDTNIETTMEITTDYIGNIEEYIGNSIQIKKEVYELNEISIVDNYFLYTEELRKKAIKGIWNRVKGFTYTDCKITSYAGKLYLKRGNKIKIQDMDESYFDTYILSHVFTYDGTFKSVIQSPALTKTQTALKNKLSISGALRKVERTCNKIDGKITDVIEEVNGQENKITSVEQTVDSITQQVTNVSTNLTNDYLTSEQVNAMNSHNEETINQLKEEFNILKQTAENLSIEIGSVSTIGVDRVKTSTGFTFDENGLDISKTGEEMHNFIDNEGVYVKRNDEEVLGADASGVRAENITVRNYLVIGKNSRIEDYKDNRTGIFYIGDN